jgi:hypothetical protein
MNAVSVAPRSTTITPLRVGFAVALTLLAGLMFLLAVDAATFLPATLARIAFPWATNEWADSTIIMQLYRLEHGGPAYAPAHLTSSYDYGPVYVYLLFFLRKLTSLPFSIVSYRTISMWLGLVSALPFLVCAGLIARGLGLLRTRSAPMLVAICAAAQLSIAVLSRNITFDSLHPDALLAALIGVALALHYALAMRLIDRRAVWLLVAVSVVTVFTKQNSFVVFPLLALGLWRTGALSTRLALGSFAAFSGFVLFVLALLPHDIREWTFEIPSSHPFEFTTWARLVEFWQFVTYWQVYLTLELVVFAGVVVLLASRHGRSEYVIHGVAAAGILVMALTAFFKALGTFNNFSIVALFCVPYCAALIGMLTTPRFVGRTNLLSLAGCALLLALIGRSLHDATRREIPDAAIMAKMSTANAALRDICARGPVLITVDPDMLLGCKNAHFSLFVSFQELTTARRQHKFGLTIFDRPTTFPYVVDVDSYAYCSIPRSWQRAYHIERQLPIVLGYGNNYFPVNMRIWARNSDG